MLIAETRAREGLKGDSSEKTEICETAGIHGASSDTPQRLNYLNVVYAARQEPLENRLA